VRLDQIILTVDGWDLDRSFVHAIKSLTNNKAGKPGEDVSLMKVNAPGILLDEVICIETFTVCSERVQQESGSNPVLRKQLHSVFAMISAESSFATCRST